MTDDHTTLLCLFHHPAQAEGALTELRRAAVPPSTITVLRYPGSDLEPSRQALLAMGVPPHDLERLLDGLRSRGVIVSVVASPKLADLVDNVFKRHSAQEIDEAIIPEGEPYLAPLEATGPLAGVPILDFERELASPADEVLDQPILAVFSEEPAGMAAVSQVPELEVVVETVIVLDEQDDDQADSLPATSAFQEPVNTPADEDLDGPAVVSLGAGEIAEPILLEVVSKPDGFLLVELPENAEPEPTPSHDRSPISPMEPSYGQTH